MDLAMKIAMLSCLVFAINYVDAEIICYANLSDPEISLLWQFVANCNDTSLVCDKVNTTVTICDNSTTSPSNESDTSCLKIESAVLNASGNGINNYTCNCESTTCGTPVSYNFTCSSEMDNTTTCTVSIVTASTIDNCMDYCASSVITFQPTTTNTNERQPSISPMSTTVSATTDSPTATTVPTPTPSIIEMPTDAITALPNNSGSTLEITTTTILWIVLGCLIAFIVIVLCAIILVCIAHCQRYKRKKQPTALDIISKWEDTPNESSEIQLLSMKTTEEGDDKTDSEDKIDEGVADPEKEEGKVGSDEKSDKVEVKESKEDDVTVGTFGFAEKPVELASVEAKTESPTGSEKKEGQSEKGEVTKEGENEKLVEVTIEKAGEESAVDIIYRSSGGNSAPNNTSVIGTATTVPTEKEKTQEGTRPEPVPVQIPIIGQQVTDVKAPAVEHVTDSEVKTSDTEQSNKPASPSKAQEEKSETSPSSQDNVLATKSVSKEPEPAATITKPQTEAVSLASDKPPSIAPSADDASGGLSLFMNEDMEKALGVAATKDLGQVESTQL